MENSAPLTVPVLILVPIFPNPPTVYIRSTSVVYYPYIPIPLSLSFSFLPHIVRLIIEPSDGLVPDIVLSIPRLSHYPLGNFDLPYKQLVPVPDVAPLPLNLPQYLTYISSFSQQGIDPHIHIHGYLFLLPLALLSVHIGVRYGRTLFHHPYWTGPSLFLIPWYPYLIAPPEGLEGAIFP